LKKYYPIDLSKVRTYELKHRKNIINIKDFAKPIPENASFDDFLNSIPNILVGKNFKLIIERVYQAYKKKRAIVFAMGAHVIKCGLGPIIIDLMKRGIITAIAFNGASAIHDFEIALIGETSESVSYYLKTGDFGMARETGEYINDAINNGCKKNIGMGEALGEKIYELKPKYQDYSILYWAYKLEIPLTVHVAIGTDITHMHPKADGSNIGKSTFTDFKLLVSIVKDLNDGGIWFNIGSAVILPEIFLKTFNLARNIGYKIENFTTVNFDKIAHYRPTQNVIKRPTLEVGTGIQIIGQHELLIPLLAKFIIEKIGNDEK